VRDLEQRYLNDPVFHAIVDQIRHFMREQHQTPTELKDAVLYAAMIEISRMPHPPEWMKR